MLREGSVRPRLQLHLGGIEGVPARCAALAAVAFAAVLRHDGGGGGGGVQVGETGVSG